MIIAQCTRPSLKLQRVVFRRTENKKPTRGRQGETLPARDLRAHVVDAARARIVANRTENLFQKSNLVRGRLKRLGAHLANLVRIRIIPARLEVRGERLIRKTAGVHGVLHHLGIQSTHR